MSSSPGQPKLVVAALCGTGDGRVLLTRRRPDQPLPDQWELPGGKIEPGEAPVEALVRELVEELGARVEVGPIWDVLHHRYPDGAVLMLVYACRLLPGESPRCIEVADLAWVTPAELDRYDVLAADRPLLDRLRDEGPPSFCSALRPAGRAGHLTSSGRQP
ncbi:MAG TPA: (deoxy)nucleoside triphosphate pyrophosphohydrolase [Kofleriaceae bacterium]|nr:(deoxy)nucleoside triphosphate pyrophosphohydrolase [Kofleriaceae bacterium]